VGAVVIEVVGEGIDEGLEAVRHVVGGVELAATSAVAALHRAAELRPLGRQHIEVELLGLQDSATYCRLSTSIAYFGAHGIGGKSRQCS
jgi:hypothetical protein